MWLFVQIFVYLVVAFAIGAVGAWMLRGRMADDSIEHLRQRFRQMVSSSEMERDAARLRVRELARRVEELEARLEGRPADGATAPATEARSPVEETPAESDEQTPVDDSGDAAPDADGEPDGPRPGALGQNAPQGPVPDERVSRDAEPAIAAPSDHGSVTLALEAEEAMEALAVPADAPDPGPGRDRNGGWEPGPVGAETSGATSEVRHGPRMPGATSAGARTGGQNGRSVSGEPQGGGGHPLSHLGEVPPEVANRLRSMGIPDTTALHRHFQDGADPLALARELDIAPRRMRRWRALAELLEVPDLAPEHAWLLEISGVASLSELAAEDPGELADRMAGINDDQGLGLPAPSQDLVASWVLWASQAGATRP